MDLNLLTIDGARKAVQDGKTSALALAESFYAKIEHDDPKIGSYLILSKERALEKANAIDEMSRSGKSLPPLGGVPGWHKGCSGHALLYAQRRGRKFWEITFLPMTALRCRAWNLRAQSSWGK